MNIINYCNVEYIRADRTIEIISLKNSAELFYVYNYQGYHFRVFTKLLDLVNFFQFGTEPKYSCGSDEELDQFIENYKFHA